MTLNAKTRLDNNRVSEFIALCSVVAYITVELLVRYSTLRSSFPILAELNVLSIGENIAMALGIAAIATRRNSTDPRTGVFIAVSLALLFTSGVLTYDYRLAHVYVLLVAIAGVRFDILFRAYYITSTVVIVLLVFASIVGFVYNKDVIPNSYLVFSYGVQHPNTFGAILFSICVAVAYVHWERKLWWVSLVVTAACCPFAFITLSSNASGVVLAGLAVVIAVGHLRRAGDGSLISEKAAFCFLVAIPVGLMIGMLVLTMIYDGDSQIFTSIDRLLHGRIGYAHKYFAENGGFTIFGKRFVSVSHYHNGISFFNVDCGYDFLALVYGILPACGLFTAYCIAAKRLARCCNRVFLLGICLLVSLHLVFECYGLLLPTCSALLFLAEAFKSEENSKPPGKMIGSSC